MTVKPYRILTSVLLGAFLFCSAAQPTELNALPKARAGLTSTLRIDRLHLPAHQSAESTACPQITSKGELENFIQTQMAQKHIAGLSSTLFKEGKVIWTGTFGYADFDAPAKPVEADTLFMLASITKTVTATALMQLWEQGLFGLHDPVSPYLPFPVIHPFFPDKSITFHMLMTHTSGIKDNWGMMPYYPGDSPILLGDYLEDYLVEGGAYYYPYSNFYEAEPGSQYHYCNVAVALAGYLVEAISGIPLEPYCQERIFKPLGMNESSYFLSNLDPEHIAMPYYWNGTTYTAYGHFGYSDYPAGQLRTSAPQLMTFLSTFMHNLNPSSPPHPPGTPGSLIENTNRNQSAGSAPSFSPSSGNPPLIWPRILKYTTVEAMLSPQIPGINQGQGLIWYKKWIGGYAHWGHNGGDQGVRTEMYYCPELAIGMVVLTNGESGLNNILESLFDYAYDY